jgi:enoyl-CoA hydratase/carnithine racemase
MAGCSHRVVTEKSRLAMPEITIGLYPDVGGSWFLARMPGKIGIFLALTGANLNAQDALFAGLADYGMAHASKAAVFDALLSQPWGQGRDAELLDRVLAGAQAASRREGVAAFVPSNLRSHFDQIEALCRRPTLPEIVDAILAVQTDDAWLLKAQSTLRAGAPGSAWLGYALQKKVRPLSLADVFRLEFVVSLHCAARPDFVEGIRALIIEKDQKPQWKPASLKQATPAWVEGFFADPWAQGGHPLADLGR